MKKTLLLILSAAICAAASAQPAGVQLTDPAPGLQYFLPAGASGFDSAVPTPEASLGYNFAEKFPEWSDVVSYMNILAASSERVSIKYFGKTFEDRPFVQIAITSPANQARLEEIRLQHLALNDPARTEEVDLTTAPLVIDLMGSIHGNEISGVTSLLASAYYYTASNDPEVLRLLDDAVIIVTPGLNPDGINRFATWVNTNSSLNHYFTPESREYNQVTPRSRSNHYWMDCNRDWLAARFDVGVNCVEMYKYWMPNVVLDLHEQGTRGKKGTYYFSPGDPNRTYKYTPQANQDLTLKISESTGAALESIGTKYFTKCNYDDFYIGKGAAYCDIQGGIGILHEQCSTRGHIAEFQNHGIFTFAQTVRNQSYATFAVVSGSYGIKDQLIKYQRDFALSMTAAGKADASKAYVFGLKDDRGLTWEFISNLLLHDIDVYPVKDQEGRYAVPLNQKRNPVIKCIFEDIREYSDSTFYDISTWSQSRAFGVDAVLTETLPALGGKIEKAGFPAGSVEGDADALAFAFVPSEYYAPYLMSALQKSGVALKVATAPFSYKCKATKTRTDFPAGTIVIPSSGQSLAPADLFETLKSYASLCGVRVKAMRADKKFSLESLSLEDVRKPSVAIIGSNQEAGSVWFLFDRRYAIEHAVINSEEFSKKSCELGRYNTIILNSPAPQSVRRELVKWVEGGGVLFLRGDARTTTSGKAFALPAIKQTEGLPMAKKGVRGVVMKADVKNPASPLLWGYDRKDFDLMSMNADFWTVPEGYDTVLAWDESAPWLSGCISKANIDRMAGTPVLVTRKVGKGAVIFSSVDFNYRSYWMTTSHIFSNAAFFGDKIQ